MLSKREFINIRPMFGPIYILYLEIYYPEQINITVKVGLYGIRDGW